MGLGIGQILDPAGVFTGAPGVEAAEKSSELQVGEIARQFDVTQANLQPSLFAGQRALGPQQQRATVGGFAGGISDLLSQLQPQLQPEIDQLLRENQFALSGSGQLRSGRALVDPANIVSGVQLPAAIEAESQIGNRLQQLIAPGSAAGGALGAFGVQAGQDISRSLTSGNQAALQAQAQGKQNAATGITALLSAFSDDDLKENREKVGEVNGHNIWSWDWKKEAKELFDLVGKGFGCMASEVIHKRPDAIHIDRGFFKVNYHKLGLEQCLVH
jgi:hypothetical protein